MFYINQNIKQNNYNLLKNFIINISGFLGLPLYVDKNQELSFNNLELYTFQKFFNNEKNFIKDYLKETATQILLPQYNDCLYSIYHKYSKIFYNYYYQCIHINYHLSALYINNNNIYQFIDFRNLISAINKSRFHSNDDLDSFFKLSTINYITQYDSSLIFIFINELYNSIWKESHFNFFYEENDTVLKKHYEFKVVPGKQLENIYTNTKKSEEKHSKILSAKNLNNPEMLKRKKLKLKVSLDGNSLKKSDNINIDANKADNNKNNNDNNDNNINHDILSSNKSSKKKNYFLKTNINCEEKKSKNGIFGLVENPFFRNNIPALNYMGHIPLIANEYNEHSRYERSKKIFGSKLVSNINDAIEDDLFSYKEIKTLTNKIRMNNIQSNDIFDIFDTKRYNKIKSEDVKNPFIKKNIPLSYYTGYIPLETITFYEGAKYKFSKKIFSDKFLSREIYNPAEYIFSSKKDKFPNVFDLLFSIKDVTNNIIIVEQNDITKILEPFLEKKKFVELLNYKFHRKTSEEIPKYWNKILKKHSKKDFGEMKSKKFSKGL